MVGDTVCCFVYTACILLCRRLAGHCKAGGGEGAIQGTHPHPHGPATKLGGKHWQQQEGMVGQRQQQLAVVAAARLPLEHLRFADQPQPNLQQRALRKLQQLRQRALVGGCCHKPHQSTNDTSREQVQHRAYDPMHACVACCCSGVLHCVWQVENHTHVSAEW